MIGPNTFAAAGRGRAIPEISDGTSNTLMVGEACGLNIVWTEPRDIDTTTIPLGVNLPGTTRTSSSSTLSSYHRGGTHVLLADGSVRFLSNEIDPSTLKALTTASGDEIIGEY